MTKTKIGKSPAETDDARSSEAPEAQKNRDALAGKAEQGLQKAIQDTSDKPKAKS